MSNEARCSCDCGCPAVQHSLIDPNYFSKSVTFRVTTAIVSILQTSVIILGSIRVVADHWTYYNFDLIWFFVRLLGAVFSITSLYAGAIWVLCCIYNKSLPRTKLFVIIEVARDIIMITAFVTGIVLMIIAAALRAGWLRPAELVFTLIFLSVGGATFVLPLLHIMTLNKEIVLKLFQIGEVEGSSTHPVSERVQQRQATSNENATEHTPLIGNNMV